MASGLFEREELNKIIHALRKHSINVFGDCDKIFRTRDVNEARLLSSKSKLITKESMSLSDVILSKAVIGEDHKEFSVAMKMWLSWDAVADRIDSVLYNFCKRLPGRCSNDDKKWIMKALGRPSEIENATAEEAFDITIEELSDVAKVESLLYEARMYYYITENIIMRNVSPGFIPLFSANSCSLSAMINALGMEYFEGEQKLVNKLSFIRSIFGDSIALNYIITGSSDIMPEFKDVVAGWNLSKSDAGTILFQAFYTLYVMDIYGIFHGDMHGENIFIQVLNTPVNMRFIINGRTIEMSTKYVFKVYDFDRGYTDILGENPITSMLIEAGEQNAMRRNADFAHLLCLCAQHEEHLDVEPFKYALTSLGLGGVSRILHGAKDFEKGTCDVEEVELSPLSSASIIRWLNTADIFESAYERKYFRISAEELAGLITSAELSALLSIFSREYKSIVNKFLIRFEEHGGIVKLWACKQWLCSPSDDIKVNLRDYFEKPEKFEKFLSIINPPLPDRSFLEYVLLPPPERVAIPEDIRGLKPSV